MSRPDAETTRPRLLRIPLGVQVLAALVVGAIIGLAAPDAGEHLKVVGDAFIRLIEMTIVPLVFPLIVTGIARMESARALGRVALKTLVYFEVVTTIVLLVALVIALATGVGDGASLGGVSQHAVSGIANSVGFQTLLLDIIPDNIFSAFSDANLLAIVFFAAFFGLAAAQVGERAEPVLVLLERLAEIMVKVIGFVVRFAPLGVLGYIAYDTAHYGWSGLRDLGEFVLVVYAGMVVLLVVVFPIIAAVFRVPYLRLVRAIWDLLVLAFLTRSSEVVLAPLMRRLEQFGADNRITSFTVPLGYSFNLDGATLYEAIAVVFIAHATGQHLGIGQLLAILGVLILLTKGLAGVPSAAIVVLLAAAKSVGLPTTYVALLLGVDFIVDMARTAVNVVGNSLATVVVAKSENAYQPALETGDRTMPDRATVA
jgi:proton glutamate symport protein